MEAKQLPTIDHLLKKIEPTLEDLALIQKREKAKQQEKVNKDKRPKKDDEKHLPNLYLKIPLDTLNQLLTKFHQGILLGKEHIVITMKPN